MRYFENNQENPKTRKENDTCKLCITKTIKILEKNRNCIMKTCTYQKKNLLKR